MLVDKNIKDFPEELNDKLRIEAAIQKTSIKQLIIKILEKYFRDKEEGQ